MTTSTKIDKGKLVEKIRALPADRQALVAKSWPKDVPSLRQDGHKQAQLQVIVELVQSIESAAAGDGDGDDEASKLRKKAHAVMAEAFGNGDDERHALVSFVTAGAKTSFADLDDDGVRKIIDACDQIELGKLVLRFASDGGPFWDDGPDGQAQAAHHDDTPEPAPWTQDEWKAFAKERSLTAAALLRQVKEIATAAGLPVPAKLSGSTAGLCLAVEATLSGGAPVESEPATDTPESETAAATPVEPATGVESTTRSWGTDTYYVNVAPKMSTFDPGLTISFSVPTTVDPEKLVRLVALLAEIGS